MCRPGREAATGIASQSVGGRIVLDLKLDAFCLIIDQRCCPSEETAMGRGEGAPSPPPLGRSWSCQWWKLLWIRRGWAPRCPEHNVSSLHFGARAVQGLTLPRALGVSMDGKGRQCQRGLSALRHGTKENKEIPVIIAGRDSQYSAHPVPVMDGVENTVLARYKHCSSSPGQPE